jgi:hypothetical protein
MIVIKVLYKYSDSGSGIRIAGKESKTVFISIPFAV